MEVFLVRVFLFSALPLALGAGIILFDRTASNRLRRVEALLIPLFLLGVGGGGIGGFIAHLFLSDAVADSIGWATGSPFQLEIAFANLAIGLLGVIAADRRDGFREATVIAATVFSVGATIVHFRDIVETGNLAPGNTIQNVSNLTKPVLLIFLLAASRRAERQPNAETFTQAFAVWRSAILRASAIAVITISTAFGIGFELHQTAVVSLLGVGVATLAFAITLASSPTHRNPGEETR